MKNLDIKSIAVTLALVVGGVALWEMGVKPMISKKSSAPAVNPSAE